MAKFNEELVNAGVLLDGDGLRPSADGARLHFHRGETTVIDGPFTESKELVAGYWILQVGSKEEALAWAKRIPTPGPDIPMQVEVRPMVEPEDFDLEFGGLGQDPWGNTRAGFTATAVINRRDFGVEWNAPLETGGVLVSDKVTIELDASVVKA